MVSVLKKTEEELGISITFSVETEPLGTGKLNFTATREERSELTIQPDLLHLQRRFWARTIPHSLSSMPMSPVHTHSRISGTPHLLDRLNSIDQQ